MPDTTREVTELTVRRDVLSTTHLHEFKSADKGQAPIMSLYLPEQKLGSHSNEGGSSNKFILKGRQTGSMHRGHTWVFRAESHDTMMAWYEDIKTLTETTPEERSHFVRSHSRSLSQSSRRSASSDGMLDEDDDEEPFSASSQIDVNPNPRQDAMSRRSQPGGRFPSDLQVNAQRGLQAPHSPSSVGSAVHEQPQDVNTAGGLPAGAYIATDLPAQTFGQEERPGGYGAQAGTPIQDQYSQAAIANHEAQQDGVNPYTSESLGQAQPSYRQDNVFAAPIITGQHQPEEQPPYHDEDTRDMSGAAGGNELAPAPETSRDMNGNANGGINVLAVNAGGFPKSEPEPAHEMEAPVPASEDASLMADTPVATPSPRPVDKTARTTSVQTISNLHIPGEYPRNSIA